MAKLEEVLPALREGKTVRIGIYTDLGIRFDPKNGKFYDSNPYEPEEHESNSLDIDQAMLLSEYWEVAP